MIKAVIFDFDGLIVDTESVWYESFHDVMQRYGVNFTIQEYKEYLGTDGTRLFEAMCSRANHQLTVDVLLKEARKSYCGIMEDMDLREGVYEYLIDAKKMGLKIGLASGSEETAIVPYLKRYKIYDFFEVIKTKNDVKRIKPDPELYRKAIADLGITKEEVFSFEDSVHGLTAAVAAGVKCVVVPNPMIKDFHFENYAYKISSMGDMKFSDVLTKISCN